MNCTSKVSFKRRKWHLPLPSDPRAVETLERLLRIPQLVARLLVQRGFGDPVLAGEFLNPEFKRLHDPKLLPNMEAAVERIVQGIKAGQKIVIFGDYDVDGITGTTMLWHLLKTAGAQVSYYIPHRVEEGYGLSIDAVNTLIDQGAELLITIDCGITAIAPIALARSRGVDVVISDHHEFHPELPAAVAIVHPRLPGSTYPNPELCGAGVAFKLAWAIASRLCGGGRVNEVYRQKLLEFSALAGLGTIADVVPLVGENRILVRYGLAQIPRSTLVGLQALIKAAGYTERKIDGTAVGFSLAPRLNAAGRMGHAHLAAELLVTEDPLRAEEIAQYLESQNHDRQVTERAMVQQAKEQLALLGENLPQVLVLSHAQWHFGVVGIVASRLVDQFYRPAFVLATDGQIAHGSARSIPGYPLHEAIEACHDLITKGGGHAMAGGVTLPHDRIALFQERLCAFAAERLTAEDLIPPLHTDGLMSLQEAQVPALEFLERLEPFGRGNPTPKFVVEKARISVAPRRVGSQGAHLQLTISQGSCQCRAIAFRMGELQPALPLGTLVDLVVEPKVDEFNGFRRVDLTVVDLVRSDREAFRLPAAISEKV